MNKLQSMLVIPFISWRSYKLEVTSIWLQRSRILNLQNQYLKDERVRSITKVPVRKSRTVVSRLRGLFAF